ncbi:MAG: GNAT family N-acetyltransferase [Bacteroidetes bacterium]|nr:GNAT family N-acetyltransferase [Bacteroidota bacterium]
MKNLPEGYSLRSANNTDSKIIKKMVFGILNEYNLNPDPGSTDKDLDDIENEYLKNNGIFEVITDNFNKIIASTGLYKIDSSTCELRKMYIIKSNRGKGIGKFLLERSLLRAKELGYKKIILETASVLHEAITLYKGYGFKEYSGEHISRRCDQRFYLDL